MCWMGCRGEMNLVNENWDWLSKQKENNEKMSH